MRPNHNKRMRGGRPQNNRRGPNPLTRSYESNGPDVKIRGNAHHIAEKYLQLARDAHTGGDPIAAENYLQHAEHYFRLIASAQAAMQAAQSGRAPGQVDGEIDELDDEEDTGGLTDRFASPLDRAPAPYSGPQPSFAAQQNPPQSQPQPQPQFGDRQPSVDREGFQPRQERQGFRGDRGQRPDRPYGNDFRAQRDRGSRDFRPYRDGTPRPDASPTAAPEGEAPGLPSFITAAPRVSSPSEVEDASSQQQSVPAEASGHDGPSEGEPADAGFDGRPSQRGRRRRLRSPYGFIRQGGGADEAGEQTSEE